MIVKEVSCWGWIVFDFGSIVNNEFYYGSGSTASHLTDTGLLEPNEGGYIEILKGSLFKGLSIEYMFQTN